tara:strand:+ start:123 stop:1262 length:1140 start_codon:yes stop_codon:yes gene_type:complete
MIKIGTDFSGIGAPEQALIKLGIEHKSIFACDVDKYAKQSYLANYKTDKFYDDITKRNQENAPYVDLYVAGFPCQAFSTSGKRKGFEDTRGTLFFDLLKYLKAKRPKYFILENVKGLLSHNGGRTFLTILDCLAKVTNGQYSLTNYEDGLNYYIYYKVLNTKDYGLPQNRERVFIVGFRDEKHSFKFPKKIPLELKLKDILQDNPNSKYNLTKKGLNILTNYQKFNKFKILDTSNDIASCITARCNKISNDNNFLKVGEKGSDDLIKVIDTGNAQTIEFVNVKPVKLGESEKFGGSVIVGKSESSYCLRANRNSAGVKIQNIIRRLTPLECFRLQGFSDSFHNKCVDAGISNTQLYKQAGNSMTVDVLAALINEILINE